MRWRHGRSDGLYTRDAALDWSGITRSARPARMDKPLRCRPLEGRRDQRSPLRRCFKPRPPLSAGCAGFASGCRLSGSELRRPRSSCESPGVCSGRLSGLLSGCPPTDTRPQARAKLGGGDISALAARCKSFFALARFFRDQGAEWLRECCSARGEETRCGLHAFNPSTSIGKLRMRLPVAANMPLQSAGTTGGSAGSPRPVGGLSVMRNSTSTGGA